MTEEETLVFTIKGLITSLGSEDQEKVKTAYNRFQAILAEDEINVMAFSLLGAELQSK